MAIPKNIWNTLTSPWIFWGLVAISGILIVYSIVGYLHYHRIWLWRNLFLTVTVLVMAVLAGTYEAFEVNFLNADRDNGYTQRDVIPVKRYILLRHTAKGWQPTVSTKKARRVKLVTQDGHSMTFDKTHDGQNQLETRVITGSRQSTSANVVIARPLDKYQGYHGARTAKTFVVVHKEPVKWNKVESSSMESDSGNY